MMEVPQTTNTTLSIGTKIQDGAISRAKRYLKENYGNKYDADPHFNFIIIAMPKDSLKAVETKLDAYFKGRKAIDLLLSDLTYNSKDKFFSIPIVGEEVMNIHKDLLNILNAERNGCMREKDLEKMHSNNRDEEEIQNIKLYGYPRMLNKFTPHVTIGNIDKHNFDLEDVTNNLKTILKDIFNATIQIDHVAVSLYVDSEVQSNFKHVWSKEYRFGD